VPDNTRVEVDRRLAMAAETVADLRLRRWKLIEQPYFFTLP